MSVFIFESPILLVLVFVVCEITEFFYAYLSD